MIIGTIKIIQLALSNKPLMSLQTIVTLPWKLQMFTWRPSYIREAIDILGEVAKGYTVNLIGHGKVYTGDYEGEFNKLSGTGYFYREESKDHFTCMSPEKFKYMHFKVYTIYFSL